MENWNQRLLLAALLIAGVPAQARDVFEEPQDVVNPEVCANCGYSGCVEISQALAARPSAIMTLFRAA